MLFSLYATLGQTILLAKLAFEGQSSGVTAVPGTFCLELPQPTHVGVAVGIRGPSYSVFEGLYLDPR